MTTVINDLTLEPKVAAPTPPPDAAAKGGGSAKPGPELERELEKVSRRGHERALRLRAY